MQSAVDLLVARELAHKLSSDAKSILVPFYGTEPGEILYMRIMASDDPLFVAANILFPFTCPDARRDVACEAIVRANFGLEFGRFEMDLSDGEMMFVCSAFPPANGVDEAAATVIDASLCYTVKFIGAFKQCLFGGASAEDAMAGIHF